MSIVLKTISGTCKQSIARVELFTNAKLDPANWEIVIHFEDATYDDNGALMDTPLFGTRVIRRKFGDIQAASVTDGTNTLTFSALASLIKAAGYQFRAEDVAKE